MIQDTMPPAVILAGGKGMRLRPMTETTPKPLLPLAGRPILFHILDRLGGMGVTKAFVMTGYLSEKIESALKGYNGKVQTECIREETPLGSAGCFSLLGDKIDEACLVVSGDAYFEFDLRPALATLREKNAAAVLCLSRVECPTAFGMVNRERDGRISGFVEKPTWSRVQGDLANTGIYVLGQTALSYLKNRKPPLDFGADVFPGLMREGKVLHGVVLGGFWCDIGTPEAFRTCNLRLTGGKNVLGAGVKLASTAVLSGCVLFDGVQVGAGATLADCIVCENVIVADGVTVAKGAVVGASAVIGDRARVGQDVLVPAGTIVAARTVLREAFSLSNGLRFEDGKLILHPSDPIAFGQRVGRAFSALAGKDNTIAVLRQTHKGCSDFFRALCEGILAAGTNLCDAGWGFPAKASFAAASGRYAYTLFVKEEGKNIAIYVYDSDGLYPSAVFERKFTDFLQKPPSVCEKIGQVHAEKQIKDRYHLSLCHLSGGKNSLAGMTAWVTGKDADAVYTLERALYEKGALLTQSADLHFHISDTTCRVSATVCGLEVDWWQIVMVLSLEQIKQTGTVYLPYCAPEAIKQAVLSAGGRCVFYTLYPENESEKAFRSRLTRYQPWITDGIAAAMVFAGLLASGKLRAAELSGICASLTTVEERVVSNDKQKMRIIKAHRREFDGEGLLCRYAKGKVRVLAEAGQSLYFRAEAADLADARELIAKLKKEIAPLDE